MSTPAPNPLNSALSGIKNMKEDFISNLILGFILLLVIFIILYTGKGVRIPVRRRNIPGGPAGIGTSRMHICDLFIPVCMSCSRYSSYTTFIYELNLPDDEFNVNHIYIH